MASHQFQFAIVPRQDPGNYRGMSIGVAGEPRVVLNKPEMREHFQFLMREARSLEDACCWHGCRKTGTPVSHPGDLGARRSLLLRSPRHRGGIRRFRVFPVDEA